MAIKFGDTLENQNSDYPVIDLTGGHAAGIVYLTTFNNDDLGDIPVNKRLQGMLVVDKTNGVVYMWKGSSNAANGGGFNDITDTDWAALGQVPLQTTNLSVQLPGSQSFGRFLNGDTITVLANGSNALEIIRDAITGYVAPTGAITSSATSFEYSTTARPDQTHTLTFTVTNENQNGVQGTASNAPFAIVSIDIRRRQGTDSYASVLGGSLIQAGSTTYGNFDDLNTAGTPAAVTFSYTDSNVDIDAQEGSSGNYDYQIVIVGNDSGGQAQSAVLVSAQNQVTIADYVAPTSTDSIRRLSSYDSPTGFAGAGGAGTVTFLASETDTTTSANIVVGDNNLRANWSITRQSPLVDMTSFTVQRVVNGTATNITNSTSGVTITGTVNAASFSVQVVDNQAPSVRASVLYRVIVVDAEQSTTLSTPQLTYLHLGYAGKSTNDNNPTSAAQAAGVYYSNSTTLSAANITGLSDRKIAASIGAVHQFTGSSTNGMVLSTTAGQWMYFCYPDGDLLTNFNAQGAANSLNADLVSSEASSSTAYSSAFTNNAISVTNVAGLTQTYSVYRSISSNAFSTGDVTFFIY